MTERQKQWLKHAVLVLAILVVGYFGVCYPLPDMPMEERLQLIEAHLGIDDTGLQAVGPTRFRTILVDHEATVVGALTASGGVVGDITGDVTGDVIADTITLESIAFGGPVTFGSATSVVSGTRIAHSLAITPTTALLSASGIVTAHPRY